MKKTKAFFEKYLPHILAVTGVILIAIGLLF